MDETITPLPKKGQETAGESSWHFRTEDQDGEYTIYLPPELNLKDAGMLDELIVRKLKDSHTHKIRIDLSENEILDAVTVHMVIKAQNAIKKEGLDKKMTFRNVVSDQANGLFDKNRMRELFEFEDSSKE